MSGSCNNVSILRDGRSVVSHHHQCHYQESRCLVESLFVDFEY